MNSASSSPGCRRRPTRQCSQNGIRRSNSKSRSPRRSASCSRAMRKSSRSSPAQDDLSTKIKMASISRAVQDNDVTSLRQLAISRGGLLEDGLRERAWPKLLVVDVDNISEKPDTAILHGHRDYEQVVLDVNRSLKRFPPGMDEQYRLSLQDQLVDVIMRVLVAHPHLHYYQGYHDIVVTFLLVVGEDLTFALMDQLSNKHLRDFMDSNMDRTKYMLSYLYPIIGRASSDLRQFMEKSEVGTIFCLSWLITWYGHVLNDLKSIIRLYDYFIACHPLMPIYLAAAIVLHREKEVLATECEMCFVHALLSKIPDDLPFEKLLVQAGDLFVLYQPESLAQEAEELYQLSLKPPKIEDSGAERRKIAAKNARNRARNQSRGLLAKLTYLSIAVAFGAAAYTYYTGSTFTGQLWA